MGLHAHARRAARAAVGDGRDDRGRARAGGSRGGSPGRRRIRRLGWPPPSAPARRAASRWWSPGAARPSTPRWRVAAILREGVARSRPGRSRAGRGPGVRAVARPAGGRRSSIGHQPRGRRRPRRSPRWRPSRAAGARTALITGSAASPAAAAADVVRRDGRDGPQLVPHGGLRVADRRRGGGRLVARRRSGGSGRSRAASWPTGSRRRTPPARAARAPTRSIAATIAGATHLLVVGTGADRITARELALKVEEASWVPVGGPRPRDVPPRPPAGDRRPRPRWCWC